MSYRIDPRTFLSAEIARIGTEQINEAIAILDEGRAKRDGGAHESRKRFKRLRGLVRLIAAGAPDFCLGEEHRIRGIAKSLSVIRDATAIVETIDRLTDDAEAPEGIDNLMGLRRGLLARRDRIVRKEGALDDTIDGAIAQLHRSAEAFNAVNLPVATDKAADLLAEGLEKTFRRAQKALRKAMKESRDEDFHELRKSVKYHEMHLHLLGDLWPETLKSRWKQAERLGDKLGRLHDIPVLATTIEGEKIGTKAERKFMQKLMQRTRKKLSEECLEEAGRLFGKQEEDIARAIAIRYAILNASPASPTLEEAPVEM